MLTKLNYRIVLFLTIIILFSSCKKDTPSSYDYTISSNSGSIINGTLTATSKDSKTYLHFVFNNTVENAAYEIHFHNGPPAAYSGYAPYSFAPFIAGPQQLVVDTSIAMPFDSFYNTYDATCVLHPYQGSAVLAKGGIGINR